MPGAFTIRKPTDAVPPERLLTPAFFSPSWPLEGAANGIVTYVALISEALRRLQHRPCILAGVLRDSDPDADIFPLEEPDTSLSRRMLDSVAFRLDPMGARRRHTSANLVRACFRAMSDRGVQILEMEETFGLARLVRRSLPIPVVVRLHGPYFANGLGAKLLETAGAADRLKQEGEAILEADGLTAPSREILDRTRAYYSVPSGKGIVIPHPAPPVPESQQWRLSECDPNVILFAGRFDRHKGGDVVIDAFRLLAQRFPQLRLWFVGQDPGFTDDRGRCWSLPEYLAENASEIAARVEILGHVPNSDLMALRRKAVATVVASRYELAGMVVIEAMACGCPVVATRTGGIPEIVNDGVNGLLCRPGDPLDLAASLTRLLSDPDLSARLGGRGQQDVARNHDAASIARQTAEFHLEVIERQPSQRRKAGLD